MPLQLDDLGLKLIGNNFRGLKFLDDNGTLQAEIYLDSVNRLNIGGVVVAGAGDGGASGSSGGGGGGATFPSAAPFLLLATDTALSGERVFTPGSGLTASDGGAGGAYTLAVDTTVVRTTRQVATGASLSGGGDLSADRTLSLNLANANTWSALQTFGAGAAISGANTLTFGGDVSLSRTAANTLTVSSGDMIRSANYVSGLSGYMISDALAEFENARIRGEFRTSALVADEMHAYAGTLIVGKSSGVLAADCTTASAIGNSFTVNAKDSDAGLALFSVNDVLWMKTFNGTAALSIYATVTAVGAASGGARNYTCRLESGSTSATISAGAAILDYGPSGTAAISLSADGAIGSSANISIFKHSGKPWLPTDPTYGVTNWVRIGNLNGSYAQTLDAFGIGLGDYSGGNYLYYDNLRGFQAKFAGGSIAFDDSGIRMTKGTGVATVGAIQWYDSTAFSSQVSALSVTRDATYGQMNLWIDARSFSLPAEIALEAWGGAPGGSTKTALTVRSDPSTSGYGVSVWGAAGLTVSSGGPTTFVSTPAGYVRATQFETGTWSAGAFTRKAHIDNLGNATLTGSILASLSIGAQARRTTALSITSGAFPVVTFDAEDYDSGTIHDLSTNTSRLTAPTDGLYVITANVAFASNATGDRKAYLCINSAGTIVGATIIAAVSQRAASADITAFPITKTHYMTAGQYVELFVSQDSGGALNLLASSFYSALFSIARIA